VSRNDGHGADSNDGDRCPDEEPRTTPLGRRGAAPRRGGAGANRLALL